MDRTTEQNTCWICGGEAVSTRDNQFDRSNVKCPRCGDFVISRTALASTIEGLEKWKLSCAVRQRHELGLSTFITYDNAKVIASGARIPRTPGDLINNIMEYLRSRTSGWGDPIPYSAETDFPALGLKDQPSFHEAISYAVERGLVVHHANRLVKITLSGWEHIDKLRAVSSESRDVFVAMWFNTDMLPVWESGIKPAVLACGYNPIRVDVQEYNEKICDMIIADIRSARFIIADLTGDRGGVYYEAGFAHGLGKQVILTCDRQWFDAHNVHFDLNHHNIIVYESPDGLKDRLVSRINATVL